MGTPVTRFGPRGTGVAPALAGDLSLPERKALAGLEFVLRVGIQEAAANGVDTAAANSLLAQIRAARAGRARVSCEGPRELLTLREAARRAGVPEATVRGWAERVDRTGLVPVGRRGEQLLWTEEDVAAAAERLGR